MKPRLQISRRLALASTTAFTAFAHAANLTWNTVAADGAAIAAADSGKLFGRLQVTEP